MPSKAFKRFSTLSDSDVLIDLHNGVVRLFTADADDQEPMPEGLDVLLRAAVVMMVSQWEAYIEDICSEGLNHLVEHVPDASILPKEIRKLIAVELKGDKNEVAVWDLAGDGWRRYLHSRLSKLKEGRDRSFNTPKAQNTADFVRCVLGIADIRESWAFDDLQPAAVAKRLDMLVEVRGQIAHRGRIEQHIDKEWVLDQMAFLRKVVAKTGGRINSHVKKVTSKPLWSA
jgi:hypothetical protein